MSSLHPLVTRPAQLCAELARDYPDLFKFVEATRLRLAAEQRWPNWTYGPTELVQAVIERYHQSMLNEIARHSQEMISKFGHMLRAIYDSRADEVAEDLIYSYIQSQVYYMAANAVALAAWRAGGKHVLILHEEVLDALWASGDPEGAIPTSVFAMTPFWSSYVIVDRLVKLDAEVNARYGHVKVKDEINVKGILFDLMWSQQYQHGLCYVSMDIERDNGTRLMVSAGVPIEEQTSVQEIMRRHINATTTGQLADDAIDDSMRLSLPTLGSLISSALQVMLYLASVNAEIRTASPPEHAAPPRPSAARREKLFAPTKETVWEVGYRVGNAIRAARQAVERVGSGKPTGRTVRPHMRRAHLHGYWVGPGRSEWRLIWLPPTPVNMPEDVDSSAWADLLPVTQRSVGGNKR